jgi:hypothetical protein
MLSEMNTSIKEMSDGRSAARSPDQWRSIADATVDLSKLATPSARSARRDQEWEIRWVAPAAMAADLSSIAAVLERIAVAVEALRSLPLPDAEPEAAVLERIAVAVEALRSLPIPDAELEA